jgi:FkbM family methyltransferase
MITGPVKFDFMAGGVKRTSMAFWCVMMKRELFDEIGLLDEIFSPGMGEDGDFSIRAEMAGHSLVQVPNNFSHMFGEGKLDNEVYAFPIYHKGSGTFGWGDYGGIIERNQKILDERYGLNQKTYEIDSRYQTNKEIRYFDDLQNADEFQNEVYEYARFLAEQNSYKTVLDIGCGSGFKLRKYFDASKYDCYGLDLDKTCSVLREKYKDVNWISYDIDNETGAPSELPPQVDLVICSDVIEHLRDPDRLMSFLKGIDYKILLLSTPDRDIISSRNGKLFGPPDNAHHIREWNKDELNRYLSKHVKVTGQAVINEAQATQMAVCIPAKTQVSIVIPTYNHCDDLLKPCIESIQQYTDMVNVELVIVANGCSDNTREYVQTLEGNVKLIWVDEAIGYTKATNLGIKAATGETIVLMNNDVLLLSQYKNFWLDVLMNALVPTNVGIVGVLENYDMYADAKFPIFFCVAIKREVFDKIGLLDEAYSPGYGEDIDFTLRAKQAGFDYIIPVATRFVDGQNVTEYPIWHKNNQTFKDVPEYLSIIQRNNRLLYEKYNPRFKSADFSIVIPTYNHLYDALKPCIESLFNYTDLSNKEVIVVANGCTDDTKPFLDSISDKVRVIWFDDPIGYINAVNAGIAVSVGKHIILLDNDCVLLPQSVDDWVNILHAPFVNSDKVAASSPFAHEYEDMGFVLHSGCTMYRADVLRQIGMFDTTYHPGYFSDSDVAMKIWKAGYECVEVPKRNDDKPYNNNLFLINFPVMHLGNVQTMDKVKDNEIVKKNREILYSRYGKKKQMKKYSIVIPTYNHCDDLLRPCLESIERYSDMSQVEVIVVANGCVDNTKEYVESLNPENFKLIWVDEAIGYTKATNLGIKAATGEYVVLLNNDTEILPSEKNAWLNILEEPFNTKKKVGLTGPLQLFDDYAGSPVLIFFCVMIKRTLFEEIGYLDEIFTPGGGEDIDFTVRANLAGYEAIQVTQTTYNGVTNVGNFPIWHKDNKTFGEIPEYTNHIVKRNGHINAKRYNKNLKLNLGSGGVPYPGYLSVDLYDKRAHVHMDITKLDFHDNTAVEILASHVFEHLNPYHALDILKDWNRVLKPGGKLIMEMPDIEALCARFADANTGERYGILNAVYGSVNTTGEGGPDNITAPHLFGWWRQSLLDHLLNAGYVDIEFMEEQIPHPESNLRVEAVKPIPNRSELYAQDPLTYDEIFGIDGYKIAKRGPLSPRGKTVVDIGANIGLFALRCVELGAARVISVEPQPAVYHQGLLRYIKDFPQVIPINRACLDVDGKQVLISDQNVASRIGYEGDPVESISLRTIVTQYNVEKDSLLKIDCEGSEYDILLNTDIDTLRLFKVIDMELHMINNVNPLYKGFEIIMNRMNEVGFKMEEFTQHYWNFTDGRVHPIDVCVLKWVRMD